ncbi:MAG: SRPBCC family protein [Crocinitomicaceae bacterium]|nr:SRPBCC family protein [Crocinitomicaceae bacterium]
MRFLLKLLFLLLSIVAIVLIVGLFVDGDFTVSRKVTINQPKEKVYDYLSMIGNQQEYGVWQKKDPKIKIKTTGTDGTVGFISSWESNMEDVGKGEQEITKLVEDKLIATEIRFIEPMETTSQAYLEIKEVSGNSCTVEWKFEGGSPYPWNILMLFMDMDKELGPDLKKGLKNLKSILESQNN